MSKSRFSDKKLKALKRYFDYYESYQFQINLPDLTRTRLHTINGLVDYCIEMKRDFNLTEEDLKKYNLIYRVSID
jgi:hypothetical protein